MSSYRISQVADRSGIPATTLRFYKQAGLLPAERTASGYRSYDDGTLERLAFISSAKHLGLPLEEIADLLTVWESGACADVRDRLRPMVAARVADAERRTAELAAFSAELHTALCRLDDMPAKSGRCDAECDFLHPSVDTERWRDAPIACTLSAVDQGERAGTWRELVADAERQPITDGVRLTVPVTLAGRIAELAAAEQRCCPFFDFHLRFAGELLHVDVRAPAHAGELLTDLFGPA
ncbi:MAG: MerR family transcriptional regulator [Pseudonocardiaceae bacterium]|nr:MerR family transcriptional regulator [Pseudonocardiaceae bacterium]